MNIGNVKLRFSSTTHNNATKTLKMMNGMGNFPVVVITIPLGMHVLENEC